MAAFDGTITVIRTMSTTPNYFFGFKPLVNFKHQAIKQVEGSYTFNVRFLKRFGGLQTEIVDIQDLLSKLEHEVSKRIVCKEFSKDFIADRQWLVSYAGFNKLKSMIDDDESFIQIPKPEVEDFGSYKRLNIIKYFDLDLFTVVNQSFRDSDGNRVTTIPDYLLLTCSSFENQTPLVSYCVNSKNDIEANVTVMFELPKFEAYRL